QMSADDPRSKRGGHRLYDHSSFPDAAILRVRGKNFMISTSYLALHSAYFYDLFYGPNSKGLNERIELDCDPHTFGDLLDIIYPSYKKRDCCRECTSSSEDRLNLAIELKMKFAIKILLEGDQLASKEDVAVSAKFPDAATVTVEEHDFIVSASALSLHSQTLSDMFYVAGEFEKEIELDVDRRSFRFRATTGNFPAEILSEFLDTLVELDAMNLYDFYICELNKNLRALTRSALCRHATKLLKHYSNQPDLSMKNL
ncbi:hypothetical protein PMAYCL1PPCAC_00300, partial [Pristionchus mayeri]